MTLRSRERRSAYDSESFKDPGPYVAVVISHLDKKYMGTLEVQLVKSNSSGNSDAEKSQTVIVKYASPFYGVTPSRALQDNDGYQYTQKSYGFWAVPPDVGSKVLVMFVEGDRSQGYWFACVPDDYMNFMVPDGRASTELTTDGTPSELRGKKLPVGEYNKAIPQDGKDTTLFKKPYNKDFTGVLEVQGLLNDEARGTTTTSARREVPSAVYGINTPGPLDKRQGAPKFARGVQGGQAEVFVNRLGGSSIVMDDGDDKFIRKTHAADGPPLYANVEAGDTAGDETIPQNELIRIRTRTGHQILLHNSEDLIYIANSRGTAWIELTSDGKIDIHADDSISIQTEQDINITAERDINMEAGRNINMKAAARWSDGRETLNGLRSGQVHIESVYDLRLVSGAATQIRSGETLDLNVDREVHIASSGDVHMNSAGNIFTAASGSVHEQAGHSWFRKTFASMFDLANGEYFEQVGGPIHTNSGDSIHSTANGDMHVLAGAGIFNAAMGGGFSLRSFGGAMLEAGSNITLASAGQTAITGNSHVYLNTGGTSGAASPPTPATPGVRGNSPSRPNTALSGESLPVLVLPRVFPGADQPVPYETIVPRAPQHEPWTHHENMNPQAFKPEQTDREAPGELPSNDRVLTPDTFLKNTAGRSTSEYVIGSGGQGMGNSGDGGAGIVAFGGGNFAPGSPAPADGVTTPPSGQGPLATVRTRNGLTAQVAAVFQQNFQGFIDELEGTGYVIRNIGGYSRRQSVGSNRWSYHASGAAIDINVPNPVVGGRPNGYFRPRPPDAPITDMPPNTAQIAARHGLGWGGAWTNLDDAMHFSAARAEGGAYALNRDGIIPIPASNYEVPSTETPNDEAEDLSQPPLG